MNSLDFLIIGAQKCATTSLFEQLREHPDINMPLEKEVPFFTREACSADDWKDFSRQHFGTADGRYWGKATPQYLCEPGCAERIHTLMPQVKLVAILRDPLARSWSHFRMGQRRGTEHRSFDEAMQSLLDPAALEQARTAPAPTHARGYEPEHDFYVSWSEYGRALGEFAQHFDPAQMLVLYTEDLERDPQGTLNTLLDFLGLPRGFQPESLGKVVHKGGSGNWIPHNARVWLRERQWVNKVWQCVPPAQQGRLRFLYEQWNTRHDPVTTGPELAPSTEAALRSHFAKDVQSLLRLPVARPPWHYESVDSG